MNNNNNSTNAETVAVEQSAVTAMPTTMQSIPLDEPPPAYEINNTLHEGSAENGGQENPGATAAAIEPPPPYCLVDPNKIHNMDHIPRYEHMTPVEIIDLNTNTSGSHQSSHYYNQNSFAGWFSSGSNMDVGTDCTFLMAFVIAFFFNWLGFLAVVCLIPTIAARFGAMSGFGLSVAKWITVMRYHEFSNPLYSRSGHTSSHYSTSPSDPAQTFLFAIVLFAGFFLFVRGLISYIAVKSRANRQGQTADVFTWY